MSKRAWVTLATNDSYGLGALVLAHSLCRVGSVYPAVVLITPAVTDPMRERLQAVFAEVVIVNVLDSNDSAHLALLQRPELGITFTKIHCWSLTQYEKCVFLDADALVVQNSDELFEREELSAAPDVGWPDCFNSGVFVYRPSQKTFDALVAFAQQHGSFDGGDQGLLNQFFSDWASGDIAKHLPFLYNVTSAAFYSYLPALKYFGRSLKIIHFIGAMKPWLQPYNWETHSIEGAGHLRDTLQLWWSIFVSSVHPKLDGAMTGVAGNLARVVASSYHGDAIDELTRRQGWEAGNIDYMGADSFDNIWAKISQTLGQQQASAEQAQPSLNQTALEKQPSPPKEQAAPVKQPSPPKQEAAPVNQPSPANQEAIPVEQPSPPKEVAAPVKQPSPPKQAAPVKQPSPPKEATCVKQPSPAKQAAPVKAPSPPKVQSAPEAAPVKIAAPAVPKTPPVTPKTTPEATTPVKETPGEVCSTPEKSLDLSASETDSPPLANTPAKESPPDTKSPNRACSLM